MPSVYEPTHELCEQLIKWTSNVNRKLLGDSGDCAPKERKEILQHLTYCINRTKGREA